MIIGNKKFNAAEIRLDFGTATSIDLEKMLETAKAKPALPWRDVMDKNIGWTDFRQGTDFSSDTIIAENLFLHVQITERKVNAGLLKHLTAVKCAQYRKINHVNFVPKKIRTQIKEDLTAELRKSGTPSVKSIWIVFSGDGNGMAGVSNLRELETVSDFCRETFGCGLTLCDMGYHLENSGFASVLCNYVSPDREMMTDLFLNPGDDYTDHPPYDMAVNSDEELSEKTYADRAAIYGELAKTSKEVHAAVENGKLLRKINLTVSGKNIPGCEENDRFEFTLHEYGILTSVKLPEPEETQEERAGIAERFTLLGKLFAWLKGRYQSFAERSASPEQFVPAGK